MQDGATLDVVCPAAEYNMISPEQALNLLSLSRTRPPPLQLQPEQQQQHLSPHQHQHQPQQVCVAFVR
jgi:hypothetical protein